MNIDGAEFKGLKFPAIYREEQAPLQHSDKTDSTGESVRDVILIGSREYVEEERPSLQQNAALGAGKKGLKRHNKGKKTEGEQVILSENENPQPTPPPIKKWTILIYEAADNDLENYMIKDVNDMENVGSTNDMNLVLQIDRGMNPSDFSGGWRGARRYKLDSNTDPYTIDSPVLEELGQINMADPKNLQDFIEWGMKKYPAQHYMLLISDHGAGWQGAIQDDSHSGWMKLPEMEAAIMAAKKNTGNEIDILGFDACLMAQTEVAYQMKDVARFMVASEEAEGAEGWPYHNILSKSVLKNLKMALMAKFNMEPEAVAKLIVRASAMDPKNLPTMSVIDLKKMDDVAKATDKLAEAILATDTPTRILKTIVRKTQQFSGYKDHYDFARRIVLSDQITDPKLKKAAQEVMDKVYEAVLYEEHSDEYPNAQGLSINLPSYRFTQMDEYRQTKFAQDTKWADVIEKLNS